MMKDAGVSAREEVTTATDPHLSEWRFEEGDEIWPGRTALRLLGGGRRYEAYLAFDDRLLTTVVIKIVRPGRATDPAALEGLHGEHEILTRLGHPDIVRCFDAVLEGPRPHLVLEFVEGPRLSTLLRKYGPLPLEQLLPLALALSSALHYLSAVGVVHLDVKPRNVIMSAPPRLIDLSVARTSEEAARIEEAVGTDAFMSPEQCLAGRGHPLGVPADVWGLGVTLYQAVSGRLPFPSPVGEDAAGFPQVGHPPEPLDRKVPALLAELIESCLRPEPAARPTAAELASELERFVAALPKNPSLNRLRPRFR